MRSGSGPCAIGSTPKNEVIIALGFGESGGLVGFRCDCVRCSSNQGCRHEAAIPHVRGWGGGEGGVKSSTAEEGA